MPNLQQFTDFLKTIDLKRYRKEYASIKIVEMDLPKDVQAIILLYRVYWDEKKFLSFEEFYERYERENQEAIEKFKKKTTMCDDCFSRGLKARIYRTWASIITQIHGGYVAEFVFGKGSVKMSRELDSMGADFRVNYKSNFLNYQVKKTTHGGVMSRKPLPRKKKLEGEDIDIKYEVPNSNIFDNPKTKKGEFRIGYIRFIDDKKTIRLPNGFVIFTPETFLSKKIEIDSKA